MPDHANRKDSCWICLLIWIKQFANKHPIVEYVKNHKRGIFCGVLNVPTLTVCTWFCCRFVFWIYFISNAFMVRLLWTYNSQDVAFCCDLYLHFANVLYSTIRYDRYLYVGNAIFLGLKILMYRLNGKCCINIVYERVIFVCLITTPLTKAINMINACRYLRIKQFLLVSLILFFWYY